jgi:predicted AAA+ superfamily ATPase
MLVIRQLQPWHANLGKRQVKIPKIYLVDTGQPKQGAHWRSTVSWCYCTGKWLSGYADSRRIDTGNRKGEALDETD